MTMLAPATCTANATTHIGAISLHMGGTFILPRCSEANECTLNSEKDLAAVTSGSTGYIPLWSLPHGRTRLDFVILLGHILSLPIEHQDTCHMRGPPCSVYPILPSRPLGCAVLVSTLMHNLLMSHTRYCLCKNLPLLNSALISPTKGIAAPHAYSTLPDIALPCSSFQCSASQRCDSQRSAWSTFEGLCACLQSGPGRLEVLTTSPCCSNA